MNIAPKHPKHPTLTLLARGILAVVAICWGARVVTLSQVATADPISASDGAASEHSVAEAWLTQSRQRLMNAPSLTLNVEQHGMLTGGPFFSQGRYHSATFPQVRLEMTTQLGDLTGRLLEVCDGQVVWTAREISGLPIPKDGDAEQEPDTGLPPGTELYVARRDIDLITDALADSPQTPAHILAAELGVGGIPALLAGLQQAFEFRAATSASGQMTLTGRWKPEMAERLAITANDKRIPTEVELHVQAGSAVPEQLAYYRMIDGNRHPILITRFTVVSESTPASEAMFRYAPPAGIDVVNRTPAVIADVTAAGE